MGRILNVQDFKEIIVGATFLCAGGGGPLSLALKMLEDLKEMNTDLSVELISAEEIGPADLAVSVVCVGSPKVWLETNANLGTGAVNSFKAFKEEYARQGKSVQYLYPIEIGAVNLFVPLMVAILLDADPKKRPVIIDADGCGRAVPELATCLVSARGIVPSPMGLCSGEGDRIIAYPAGNESAEAIARNICTAFGMKVGLCSWVLNRNEIIENLVPNTITNCQNVGKMLLTAQEFGGDIFAEMSKTMEIRPICHGRVLDIESKSEGGFDFGTTTIADDNGNLYYIDFQNENILMRDGAGKVLLTVPELICVLETDTYRPLTNAEMKKDMNISVAFMPAYHQWWNEDKKAYRCWEHVLRDILYEGEMVRY